MGNTYNCVACGAQATKTALVPQKVDGKGPFLGLGTWRCTKGCSGKIKVKRTKLKDEE